MSKSWYLDVSSVEDAPELCSVCAEIDFHWLTQNELKRRNLTFRNYVPGTSVIVERSQSPDILLSRPAYHTIPELSLGYLTDLVSRAAQCNFCRLVVLTIAEYYNVEYDRLLQSELNLRSIEHVYCSLSNDQKTFTKFPRDRTPPRMSLNVTHDIDVLLWDYHDPFAMPGYFESIKIHAICRTGTPFEGKIVRNELDTSALRHMIEQLDPEGNQIAADRPEECMVDGFRVIDVVDGNVLPVRGPLGCRYLTLSYVWGGDQKFKNTIARDTYLRQPGSLFSSQSELPKTIRNAIDFTRSIGERFLWVDSLCILQDDGVCKMRQINAMGQIYTLSLITISAWFGANADAGLPGVDPSIRRTKQHVIQIRGIEYANVVEDGGSQGVHMYAARAWTYQEQCLSRRHINFSRSKIILESEEGFIPEDLHSAPLAECVNLSVLEKFGPPVFKRQKFLEPFYALPDMYGTHVTFYSGRSLTNQSDALNGLAGLIDVLTPYFRRPFVWGLSTSELETGLLWRPQAVMERRIGDRRECAFPSWSWVGWQGGVEYPMTTVQSSSRISVIDAQTKQMFTTKEFRGADIEDGGNSTWSAYPRGSCYGPVYFENEFPDVRYLHPTAETPPFHLRDATFVERGSCILTLYAHTATLTVAHGDLYDSSWSIGRDDKPRPGAHGRTFLDRYGYECGTLDLHGGPLIHETQDAKIDVLVVSRRAGYLEWPYPTVPPPDNDNDVYAAVSDYSSRQRIRNERSAASYYSNEQVDDLEWQYYDVLALEWKGEIAERVGIGFVHVEAFWDSKPVKRQVPLM